MPRAQRPPTSRRRRDAVVRVVLAALVTLLAGMTDATGAARDPAAATVSKRSDVPVARDWMWPVEAFHWERPYEAPAHRYGTGHRGVDLHPLESTAVRAPADGAIAFAGVVADRGVLTIDHGDGLVTTLEPVESALEAGDAVAAGDDVATLSVGGHAVPGTLHFGVRYRGEYINPLLLLGGVPRAVLLPCC